MASGNVHDDLSPRLLPPLAKPTNQRQTDKEFDIRLSRIPQSNENTKVSMLAYTENVRKAKVKVKPTHVTQLALRAHHGPKNASSITVRHRRKALSLSELLERRKTSNIEKRSAAATKSLSSVKLAHLPPRHLKISFVSASDLHDIFDCNIGSAGEHSGNLRLALLGSSAPLPWINQTGKDTSTHCHKTGDKFHPSHVHAETKFKSDFPLFKESSPDSAIPDPKPSTKPESSASLEPLHFNSESPDRVKMIRKIITPSRHSYLRYRPRRAKRMVLQRPELGVIPEGDGDIDQGTRNIGLREHLPSRTSLDAIRLNKAQQVPISSQSFLFEQLNPSESETEATKITDSSNVESSLRRSQGVTESEGRGLPADQIFSKERKKNTQKTKVKASMKMNKLIFLRDFPDKHFQRK